MDMKQLMKQAQEMQKKIKSEQDAMESKEFEGKSGAGLVAIKMTGTGNMQSVKIDKSLLQENEGEMLEDLIIAAFNDAKTKADSESKNSLSDVFRGISI